MNKRPVMLVVQEIVGWILFLIMSATVVYLLFWPLPELSA
jgi:hypothetical protein